MCHLRALENLARGNIGDNPALIPVTGLNRVALQGRQSARPGFINSTTIGWVLVALNMINFGRLLTCEYPSERSFLTNLIYVPIYAPVATGAIYEEVARAVPSRNGLRFRDNNEPSRNVFAHRIIEKIVAITLIYFAYFLSDHDLKELRWPFLCFGCIVFTGKAIDNHNANWIR